MFDGNQPSPAGALADEWSGSGAWDVSIQVQRTRQWQVEGTHLLRAADFHLWAAAGWPTLP